MVLRSSRRSMVVLIATFLLLTRVSAAQEPAAPSPSGGPQRPNFVVILVDDFDREMLNYLPQAGNRNLTPNLDRLAREGVVLDGQRVVAPLCTPMRYSLLTGRQASRAGNRQFLRARESLGTAYVEFNTRIVPDEPTFPQALERSGYRTGTVGKHHCVDWTDVIPVGSAADANDPEVARRLRDNGARMEETLRRCGFSFAARIYDGNVREGYPREIAVHNLDWLVEGALEFLDGVGRQPFFLFFAPTVAHAPSEPERSHGADPRASGYGWLEQAPSVLPPRASLRERLIAAGFDPDARRLQPANLLWLDDAIGALLARLERIGALGQTMIVFLNDNGQEDKGSLYEAGTHCPGFIWRSGGFPCGPRLASLVTNLDVAPTLLDYAGVTTPDTAFDGASLRPLLEGTATQVRDHVYFEVGFARGILHDGFKYIATRIPADAPASLDFRRRSQDARKDGRDPDSRYGHLAGGPMEQAVRRRHPAYDARDQLYQLATDPEERTNLAGQPRHAARLARMKELLRLELARLPGAFGEFTEAAAPAKDGGE